MILSTHYLLQPFFVHISLVAAASENNVIGDENEIPWHLPDDMKFFREITEGKPIIMGRKTFESIGKPLPKRHNIVISRQRDLEIEGCDVVGSLEEALELAEEESADEACIIGGGQIYSEGIDQADRIYLTRVHATVDGDTYFPEVDEEEWEEIDRQDHDKDEQHEYAFSIIHYERV